MTQSLSCWKHLKSFLRCHLVIFSIHGLLSLKTFEIIFHLQTLSQSDYTEKKVIIVLFHHSCFLVKATIKKRIVFSSSRWIILRAWLSQSKYQKIHTCWLNIWSLTYLFSWVIFISLHHFTELITISPVVARIMGSLQSSLTMYAYFHQHPGGLMVRSLACRWKGHGFDSHSVQIHWAEKIIKKLDGNHDAGQKCWLVVVVHGEQSTRNVAILWLYVHGKHMVKA